MDTDTQEYTVVTLVKQDNTVWASTEFLQGLETAVLTFLNKMAKMLFFLA